MWGLKFCRISIFILLIYFTVGSVTGLTETKLYIDDDSVSQISQVPSGPIIINGDNGFASFANSGDGSPDNPYIITNREIQEWNIQTGILISDTTKYFEITNNFISSGDINGVYGIHLRNIASGTAKITNNVLESNYIGIKLEEAPFSEVSQNYISHNRYFGIEVLDGSENSIIANNQIEFSLQAGINVEGEGSIIDNNNITIAGSDYQLDYGIGIHRDNIQVTNNLIQGSMDGINVSPASNVLIENNTIDGAANGIAGWPSNSQIISNRLYNGNNNGDGIRLQGEYSNWVANNNQIVNNHIENYPNFGLYIRENSYFNLIQYNHFLNNNYDQVGSSQGLDNGNDNEIINNYWDEWATPDSDQDGFVDLAYPINGLILNEDSQPSVSMEIAKEKFYGNEDVLLEGEEEIKDDEPIQIDKTLVLNPLVLVTAFMIALAVPILKIIKIFNNNATAKLISGTLTGMIGFVPPMLVGVINSNQDNSAEFEDIVPLELKQYKYILNPIRLSIIKILYTFSSYPAFMVRENLQISWGKFSSHINSLVEKGYISSQEEFYDGSPTRILRIEHLGNIKYQELREILKNMFEIDDN